MPLLWPLLIPLFYSHDPSSACAMKAPCPVCKTCSSCRHCKLVGGCCRACKCLDREVNRVIDVDTIVAQVAGRPETIRMIGVHAPETNDPRKPVQRFGEEAHKFTARLLDGQRVRLEIQTKPRDRDRYGRLLAYVFRERDGLFVNREIIRQGYGHAYLKYPFDPARMKEFRDAERKAIEGRQGLWAPE